METWTIIIIILAVINVIAFGTAIWVSYDKWKQSEREWVIPLMGLFFIPLCVFLFLAWPYMVYKENRAKLLEEQEREEAKKRRERSKKYHFKRFGFRLKALPFKPTSQELIYVENDFDERINKIIQGNLEYIQACLDESRFFTSRFVYFPNLIEELSHEESAIKYIAPSIKEKSLPSQLRLNSNFLLDYMAVPEHRGNITPCFARYVGVDSGCSLFECVGFDPEDDIDEKEFLKLLCSAFDHYPMSPGPVYHSIKVKKSEAEQDADAEFEESVKLLLKEVEEKISKLRKIGVSQWALEQLVKPELKYSRLVITKDYRIVLPDYNSMEIKMEPLVKAVYLLFLNHPEGIYFKHLPDYREELAHIYNKVRPMGMNDRTLRSIEDVTNPMLNSINEKCARIRGAFVGRFDDHMARHYYIDGLRGEAKKIALPRNLVVWE